MFNHRTLPRFAFALLTPLLAGASFAASIPLSWNAVPGADVSGYRVYVGTSTGHYDRFVNVAGASSLSLGGLANCRRHYVAVRAYDTSGNLSSGYSNELSGFPTPMAYAVLPQLIERGQSLTLSLFGYNFESGATVTFTDPKITVRSTMYVSCSKLLVAVTVAGDAVPGVKPFQILNPSRTYAGSSALWVTGVSYPAVTAAIPSSGQTGVSITERPRITFSEPMDATSITASRLRIVLSNGTPILQASGSPSLDASRTVATLTPAANLQNGTGYRLQVVGGTSGVRDSQGTTMLATYAQSGLFQTVVTAQYGLPGDTLSNPPVSETTAAQELPGSSSILGPLVLSSEPEDGIDLIPREVVPTVTFSEPVDPATVTTHSVQLVGPDDAPIEQAEGSPSVDEHGLTVAVTPEERLEEGASYRIRIVGGADGVRNQRGLPMFASFEQREGFHTKRAEHDGRLAVEACDPADGARDVLPDASTAVRFSEPLDPNSITAATVRLVGPRGTEVGQAPGSPVLEACGTVVTLVPAEPLEAGQPYRIAVLGGGDGVRSAHGTSLHGSFAQESGFTILSRDARGPRLSSIEPSNGSSGVSLDVRPTVSFAESVDPVSVSASTIALLLPDGTPVPQAAGSPAIDLSGRVVTIVPAEPLFGRTLYRLRIEAGPNGVRTMEGDGMATIRSPEASFETAEGRHWSPHRDR